MFTNTHTLRNMFFATAAALLDRLRFGRLQEG